MSGFGWTVGTYSNCSQGLSFDQRHSTFSRRYFLKMTGSIARTANTPRTATDVHVTVSLDDVRDCSVVPAWMARNDGGATPVNRHIDEFSKNY